MLQPLAIEIAVVQGLRHPNSPPLGPRPYWSDRKTGATGLKPRPVDQ